MASKKIKYYLYPEGEFIVAQSLNIEVSSFGKDKDKEEAIANLKEAVELYFQDEEMNALPRPELEIGEMAI